MMDTAQLWDRGSIQPRSAFSAFVTHGNPMKNINLIGANPNANMRQVIRVD